jgi:hypothetical protein
MDCSETPLLWGRFRKHSLTHSVAYTDGSALQTSPRAGFSIVFSDQASQDIARTFRSRVPGEQSISRAEAFAVLGALLVTKPNVHLTIYCNRLSLVNQFNRLLNTTAFHSPPHRLSDRSLILRILHKIRTRPAPTILYHVKAHTRDHCPLPPNFAALRGVALYQ